MKLSEIKSPADLVAAVQAWGVEHQTAMNGLIDKMPDGLKTEWLALKSGLNDILAKLKPIDAVPAAMDASYALNSFARTINDLMEYADNFRTRMGNFTTELNQKTTALNGLEKKITDGDLLPKDKYTPLIDTAREDGSKKTMELVTATRKTLIALAGLPDADPATLALGVPEFDAAVNTAKANLETLKKKGLVLGGKGDAWVKDLAWKTGTAFQGQMTKIEELVTGFKTPAGGTPDPLLGGAGGAGGAGAAAGAETEKPRRLTLA
jgi:hypothetical protein